MTVWDAAKEISVSPWTLRKHLAQGSIRATRIGRLVRLSREEVERIQREGLPSIKHKRD
jgi:excisionase family DNA binding protein